MTGAAVALALIQQCAPQVAPATVQAIIGVESAGDPIAININGAGGGAHHPRTLAEAVRIAHQAIKDGHTVDIGLMQVNSATGAKLGYTVEQLFDPCTNLHAGATVLRTAYREAASTSGEGQGALQAALSAYNTGNFTQGFSNGYVGRYYAGSAVAPKERAPSPYTITSTIYTRQETPNERASKASADHDDAADDATAFNQP